MPDGPFDIPAATSPWGTPRNAEEWVMTARRVIRHLRDLHRGKLFTGERLNRVVTQTYCAPHDPHVWGTLTAWAKKEGLIEKTGVRLPMQKGSSHGRMTDQYRFK